MHQTFFRNFLKSEQNDRRLAFHFYDIACIVPLHQYE